MATVLNDSSLQVFEDLRLACEAADNIAAPVAVRLWIDKLGFYVEARQWVGNRGHHNSLATSTRHFPWFDIMLARHNKLLEAVEQTAEDVRRKAGEAR